MDTRNSALVVGVYLLGAVAVAGVMYYAYDRTVAVSQAQLQMHEEVDATSAPVVRVPFRAAGPLSANRPTLNLQVSLAQTRDQLERRIQELNRKNAECQALKVELDESFALIMSLLADEKKETQTQARGKLDAELARLQEAIASAEALNVQREQQLADLEAEVMQRTLDLQATREQAEQDLQAVSSQRDNLDEASRLVIERTGAAAVPALLELLADKSPEVRAWAAQCLTTLGVEVPDAQLADPQLD